MKRQEYVDHKVCSKCGVDKSIEDYWKRGSPRKDGTYAYRDYCKECGIEDRLHKYHHEGGKQKQKERSFKHNMKKYGITPDDYQQLFQQQDGKCAICFTNVVCRTRVTYNLFVDHDHQSGKVRGLLCHHCNAGLGHFRDSVENLQTAINYLNENRS
jgi:hypothetical protein